MSSGSEARAPRQLLLGTLAAIVLLSSGPVSAEDRSAPRAHCKGNPELVEPCFTVHGRLFAANGTPSLRIWPIGTKRILGVHHDEEPWSVPGCLSPHIGFDKDLYADFLLCPFTHERTGRMRFVCIESASRMLVQDSTSASAGGKPRFYKLAGTCSTR